MRPLTMAMCQRKLITKQGTSLTFSDVIRSGMSYDPRWTPMIYGKCHQASTPTPDAPVTVQAVAGNLAVCGKNLIPYPYASGVSLAGNGITFTVNTDRSVRAVGIATDYAYYGIASISSPLNLVIGKTYTVSGAIGSNRNFALIPIINGSVSWPNAVYVTTTKTFTPAYDKYSMVIQIAPAAGAIDITFYPQLEFGSAATPYAPYAGRTVTLPTLCGIEVASTASPNVSWIDSGVTKYAVADTWEPCVMVDGTMRSRKVQRIGVKVFDGTETWTLSSTYSNTDYAVFYSYELPSVAVFGQAISTHFTLNRNNTFNSTINSENFYTNVINDVSLFVKILKSRLSSLDVAGFKSFLAAQYAAGTPVTVYYVLATPVVTLGDPVPLETYHPITNIYTTSAVQGQIKASVLVPRAV